MNAFSAVRDRTVLQQKHHQFPAYKFKMSSVCLCGTWKSGIALNGEIIAELFLDGGICYSYREPVRRNSRESVWNGSDTYGNERSVTGSIAKVGVGVRGGKM